MFFRFGSALVLVVLIAMTGVAFEKRTLELRRNVTRQQYQMDLLQDAYSRSRLKTQQLGAPKRVIDAMEKGELELERTKRPTAEASSQTPLLHWQQAAPVTK